MSTFKLPLAGYATSSSYYEYFGGKMIRNMQGWVSQDRLGSVGKYFPYGQERPSATPEGTEKFATYFRDENTGLDYAQNRYHKPGEGRFMSVDPSLYANTGDPNTWNQYAYTHGDPIGRTDPSGLCDVINAGITQSPSPRGQEGPLAALARSTGATQSYPFAGQNIPRSVLNGVFGNQTAALATLIDAINHAAADSGAMNLILYSGSSELFADIVQNGLISQDVLNRIETVTYLAPGGAGRFAEGPWRTNIVYGSPLDPLNLLAGGLMSPTTHGISTNCNHTDLACLIAAAGAFLADRNSTPCSDAAVFSRPSYVTPPNGRGSRGRLGSTTATGGITDLDRFGPLFPTIVIVVNPIPFVTSRIVDPCEGEEKKHAC